MSYYSGEGEQALRPYLSGRTVYSTVSGGDFGLLSYGASAGVLYLLTRSVGLDASLFYNAMSYTGSGPSGGADVLGLSVGFSAFAF